MSWMLTAHGNEVDLVYPRPGAITLADIAHHLSTINRFTGAACRPYSVAEHSLLVCEIAEREFGLDVHGLLASLMHDAHEAYTTDLSTPAKQEVGDGWHRFENKFVRLVRSCFALHVAAHDNAHFIHQADRIALATERVQLLPAGGLVWEVLTHVQPVRWVDLMSAERQAMTWRDWRSAFSDRYHELEFARIERVNALGQPSTVSR